jgi:phospholipase/carboxylesterase
MNRLAIGSLDVPAGHDASTVGEASLRTVPQGDTPHSLFVPLHYESNYAYPLLIWLHGSGDDEQQLRRIMPMVSMRNYVAVAPRAPHRHERRDVGYAWSQTPGGIVAARNRVFDCLDIVRRRYRVALNKVFVAGYGSGGTMALRLGVLDGERFAGAASMGGPFPSSHTPLLRLAQARFMQVLISSGRDSSTYPVEQTCRELRLFHAAGLSVTLRQYPCGDELTALMLHDLNVWTMEQVTGLAMSPSGGPALPPEAAN